MPSFARPCSLCFTVDRTTFVVSIVIASCPGIFFVASARLALPLIQTSFRGSVQLGKGCLLASAVRIIR